MSGENNQTPLDPLAELNQLFSTRYTEADPEYQNMAHRPNNPPIVDDWPVGRSNSRPQRFNNGNQRWNNHRNNREPNPHYSNDRRGFSNHQERDSRYSNDQRSQSYTRERDSHYSNDRERDSRYSNDQRHQSYTRERESHDRHHSDDRNYPRHNNHRHRSRSPNHQHRR